MNQDFILDIIFLSILSLSSIIVFTKEQVADTNDGLGLAFMGVSLVAWGIFVYLHIPATVAGGFLGG